MITLYTFGPKFGLPDPSPFCMKAIVLLKMAGLEFKTDAANLQKAPKSKAPYMDDDGTIVADSTFIRLYLEKTRGIDFDEGLSATDRAISWAFEKLCEDNLYWAIVEARWMNDRNFNAGPVQFFEAVPAIVRPLLVPIVRRQVRRDLKGQGTGRHSEAEIAELATRGIVGLATFLGDKPYLMGDKPCGADASVFSTVSSLLCEVFDTPLLDATKKHENLVAYRDRLMAQYFPD
ncbi:MAG: glutathione S-transferase family protein [Hyphomicrobiaceae bacterium]|nr:glutathione S-transferase family protein [Hyphomicrobiaceae bacterium]